MNVFAQWTFMRPSDRLLNLLTRPFGWDVVVERNGGWLDFKRYDLGVEHRVTSGHDTTELWVGPLNILATRV